MNAQRGEPRVDLLSPGSQLVMVLSPLSPAALRGGKNAHQEILLADVEKAINEKIYRSDLPEEKMQDFIEEGMLFIETKGEVVGQINGLSVYALGDHAFGRPSRITATYSLGKEGVVAIDWEAQMAGTIHNKGVLFLSGYLKSRFAQDKPLTLSASLTFEQSYGMVEGDSASMAELVALTSVLADLPLKQNLAITGSVSQRGEAQPIGGANWKIEGFYKVAKSRGLDGSHGDDFCELYEWFFEERKKYDKKNPLNYLFKIILNSTYGLSKNKHSFLYDPELTFRITVNGQLLLSMLYENVMLAIPDAKPLMQNTDGLEFRIRRDQMPVFEQVCKDWEEMTSLQLEIDTYQKMVIADVNNYIAVYGKGKGPKCKGRFEWKDLALHKNKSFLVVSKALYEWNLIAW